MSTDDLAARALCTCDLAYQAVPCLACCPTRRSREEAATWFLNAAEVFAQPAEHYGYPEGIPEAAIAGIASAKRQLGLDDAQLGLLVELREGGLDLSEAVAVATKARELSEATR